MHLQWNVNNGGIDVRKKPVLIWFLGIPIFLLFLFIKYSPPTFAIKVQGKDYFADHTQERVIQDVKDYIYTYYLSKNGKNQLTITKRVFPNQDYMLFIQLENSSLREDVSICIPLKGNKKEKIIAKDSIEQLYPYRKPRTLEDPLSTSLYYLKLDTSSVVYGPQIYYRDISEQDENNRTSHVIEFIREEHNMEFERDCLTLRIEFKEREETHFSTWLMISNDHLFPNETLFKEAHQVGVDEFRFITPDTLWSHGLTTIYPSSENAFVRSLVRQSGRMSSVKLEKEKTRFWENINRHQFLSLEQSRHDDGLWYSDYVSTWLKDNYGINSHYVDSRHNDNIFRSQLRRAKLLGYDDYLNEIYTYADFLLEMVDKNYILPANEGYYIIDYFDGNHKTHVSLNHTLSMMNYLYDTYLYSDDERYLISAEKQLQAIESMEGQWLDEDGILNYQLNLDGSFEGKDYNLVTYYDLLYTKKLRSKIGLNESDAISNFITAKERYLKENGIPIEGTIENVEHFIGLIE